jgi:hypothetical protein
MVECLKKGAPASAGFLTFGLAAEDRLALSFQLPPPAHLLLQIDQHKFSIMRGASKWNKNLRARGQKPSRPLAFPSGGGLREWCLG